MKSKILLLFFLSFVFSSCQYRGVDGSTSVDIEYKNKKIVEYFDIPFTEAWQISLASLTQKGNVLSNDQNSGELIIKIHSTPVRVHIAQVTPVSVKYTVSVKRDNRSAVELVRAILKYNFEQANY